MNIFVFNVYKLSGAMSQDGGRGTVRYNVRYGTLNSINTGA